MAQQNGVLVIYTGGTIGSLPKDEDDPMSSLVSKSLDRVMERMPNYDKRDKKIFIEGSWIRLGLQSWDPPVDSSNIDAKDWTKMAEVIYENYNDWDGFVILHGTDTMAYTSSALAFMLDNLSKPVVITGSQKPIGRARSDAVQNVISAIEIAAAAILDSQVVPEVTVFFRDELYRGCRTTKLSASEYNAFYSPNYPPLAKAGEHIKVNKAAVKKASQQRLNINTKLEKNIASLDIFPGMSTELLRNILATEDLRGVVMQTFGTGNAPTIPEFLDVIKEAVERGLVIVDITQCRSGEVELGLYEVSAGLLSRGVVSGTDMTPDAALTKLAVVLGNESDPRIAADIMQLNLKGEQRQSIFNLHFDGGRAEHGSPQVLLQRDRMEEGHKYGHRYDSSGLDQAILRIMDVELEYEARGRIELKAYINKTDVDENTKDDIPNFLGRGIRTYDPKDGAINIFWNINRQARDFVDPRHDTSITVVCEGGPFRWNKANIALFTNSG